MNNAWQDGEAPLVDERAFTSWAEPGWMSWNVHSPELRFCEAAASLVERVDGLVIETGGGQGYITRRAAPMADDYLVYESSKQMRDLIASGDFRVASGVTPGPEMSECKLLIADSALEYRLKEMHRWEMEAPDDSLLLVHDAGNGHEGRGDHYSHNHHWPFIQNMGIEGIRYKNPRGSFLGWKQEPEMLDWLLELLPNDYVS